MFKKVGVVVALGLLTGLTALGPAVTSVAAASTGNVSVADGQWRALPAGEQAWYTFDYSGDGSQVEIRMATPNVGSPNGSGFEVWTPEQYAQYQRGGAVEPIGRGSANSDLGGDLFWTGNFNDAGTYHVIVTAGSGQADYSLTIKGSGVSLPVAQPEVAASAAKPASTAAVAAKPASTVAAEKNNGAAPSSALTADGKWANVAAAQQVWYAIPYGGGNAQMVIRMAVDPNSPASFEVYTAAEVANGGDPVGRGSVDAAMGGDLVWAGGFADAGTVYVLVSGNGVGNTGYALTVE